MDALTDEGPSAIRPNQARSLKWFAIGASALGLSVVALWNPLDLLVLDRWMPLFAVLLIGAFALIEFGAWERMEPSLFKRVVGGTVVCLVLAAIGVGAGLLLLLQAFGTKEIGRVGTVDGVSVYEMREEVVLSSCMRFELRTGSGLATRHWDVGGCIDTAALNNNAELEGDVLRFDYRGDTCSYQVDVENLRLVPIDKECDPL